MPIISTSSVGDVVGTFVIVGDHVGSDDGMVDGVPDNEIVGVTDGTLVALNDGEKEELGFTDGFMES